MRTKTLSLARPIQIVLVLALILTLVLSFLLPSPAKTGGNIQPALLLQDEPGLTPDQVKYRLLNTAGGIKDSNRVVWPYLNTQNAVEGTSTESANTGLQASQLLWTGDEPVVWGSVAWNSVSWNSVSWNSVSWNSVSWNE